MERRDSRWRVIDELQRLRENDAVETVPRQRLGGLKIADDRRVGIVRRNHVENVASCHTLAAKAPRIAQFLDLKNASSNIAAMLVEDAAM